MGALTSFSVTICSDLRVMRDSGTWIAFMFSLLCGLILVVVMIERTLEIKARFQCLVALSGHSFLTLLYGDSKSSQANFRGALSVVIPSA